MKHQQSRRDFFVQTAAAAGALTILSPLDAGATAQSGPSGDEALVAPQFRGFLRKNVKDLPTPALVVDLDVLDRNLQAMAAFLKGKPVVFRPHVKAHKSPTIAKMQIASGAKGVCATTLNETGALVAGGVKDVLITAEVAGPQKVKRLMELLAAAPELKVVVDNPQNAMDLSAAALAAKRKLRVLIDVNVGQNVTGVETPADAVTLAQVIAKQRGIELVGVQGFCSANQRLVGFDNRKAREGESNAKAIAVRQALEKAGFPIQMVSVGGTGCYNIDAGTPGITEIQPGSYVFMDARYAKIGGQNQAAFTDFGNALSVLTSVISRAVGVVARTGGAGPAAGAPGGAAGAAGGGRAGGGRAGAPPADPRPVVGRAVVDAGIKSLPSDGGSAEPLDLPGTTYGGSGDEYGALSFRDASFSDKVKVGDKFQVVPAKCDTTINIYNAYFGVRKGVVEHVWPIEGRG